jgi:cytoskeletal protein RodZ
MSDFDQLIKEKINSKEYAYSAKNWQSFTQKAGWRRGFSLTQWLLTVAAVVVVAAGGGLAYWLWAGGKQSVDTRMQEQPTVEAATAPAMETTESTVEIPTEPATEVQSDNAVNQTVTSGKAASANNSSAPKATPEQHNTPAADTTVTCNPPAQKPVRRDRITRIFVIDPDTIPSNDF